MKDIREITDNLALLRRIVGQKVQLDSRGFGPCPFHVEKTPSFHIFRGESGRAKFYCFGCEMHGDILDYMHHIYGLRFTAARDRLEEILTTENISPDSPSLLSSPPGPMNEGPEIQTPSTMLPEEFCEKDCQKYLNLRDDYHILLEENIALRERLGMSEFRPSNETQETRPMRRIILESPYAGDIEANVRYAQKALKDSLDRGEAPLASHLLYPQVLDDTKPEERKLGIAVGFEWMGLADAMAVYTDHGISRGMKAAIDYAHVISLPVEYRSLVDDAK